MSILSQRLKEERSRKNLTQKQVEELTSINYKTLSGYENDVSDPDLSTLSTLARLYAVTTDYLLGNTDERRPVNPSTNKSASAKETRQLEKLLEMDGLTFKGAPLSEDDKNKIKAALEIAFWDAKEKNKRS